MRPLALIIFTVTSGPSEGMQFESLTLEPCSRAVIEQTLAELEADGFPAIAQCEYGNGPLTSMRPVARTTETDE